MKYANGRWVWQFILPKDATRFSSWVSYSWVVYPRDASGEYVRGKCGWRFLGLERDFIEDRDNNEQHL